MPAPATGQLPMPPLQTYVALSFLFLAWSLLQAREGLTLLETMQAGTGPKGSPSPGQEVLINMDPAAPAVTDDPGGVTDSKDLLDNVLTGFSPAGVDPGEANSKEPGDLPLDESPSGATWSPVPAASSSPYPYEGYIAGSEPRPGPKDSSPLESSPESTGPNDGPDITKVGGPHPDQIQEEILQNLSLDFGINEDDSDMVKILKLMLQDSLSVVVVMNMAFCCLLLLGKAIQHIVFGNLRVIERQHLRDKLWNFSFYKLIVVFGVLNVQTLEELVLWVGWFAVLAFLHGFAQLSKDRFEYLSFSPTTSTKTHSLVIGLLALILAVTCVLISFSFYLCYHVDWNLLFFMLAECILVAVRAIFVLARYAIHLYDLHHEGVWENRGSLIYHTELVLELCTLSLDFVHHFHMLLWVNVFLSMASLLICMQLRHLYYEIQRRVQRHRNYRRVVANMEARFPRATEEDLVANNDDCAICWEEMKGARKLPCGHLFHDACLRSWLEHETSCPTCRQSLNIQTTPTRPAPGRIPRMGPGARPNPGTGGAGMMGGGEARPNQPVNLRNHFFHFDGSRIFSWLPSFSVEVTHAHVMGPQTARTSQLDNMARQVSQMFPNVPLRSILEDLRITRSIELTVDNILDGRVATIGIGGDNSPPADNNAQEGAAGDTFPRFQPNQEGGGGGHEEEGLLYRQTRHAGEGAGRSEEATGAMEGSEDNAANWNRPNNGEGTSSDSTEQEPTSGFPSYSSRFSKSATERETILRQRKEKLLQLARRKFQEKQLKESLAANQSMPSSSKSSTLPSSSLSSITIQPSTQNPAPSHHPSTSRQTLFFPLSSAATTEEGNGSFDDRQRVRAATLEAALRRLQQQQRPL